MLPVVHELYPLGTIDFAHEIRGFHGNRDRSQQDPVPGDHDRVLRSGPQLAGRAPNRWRHGNILVGYSVTCSTPLAPPAPPVVPVFALPALPAVLDESVHVFVATL